LAVVAALALSGGGGAYWYFGYGPGSLVTVPKVEALDQAEALDRIEAAQLTARVANEFSDDVAEGGVISATPKAGQRVKPGSIVDLVVSKGPRMATVPQEGVVGATSAEAQAALIAAGLDGEVSVEQVYDTLQPADTVLSVSPEGGSAVPHFEAVTLVVSKGPEPADIPDFTGMTVEEAQAAAAEWEMTVSRTDDEYSETVPEGKIISQDPDPGASSFRGAEISVVVSLGMPFVTVPQLFDKKWEDAVAALEDVGLKAERGGTSILDRVVSTDPGAGESVRKGSTVRVVLF
jgi:serine/threonine-protein kinase